ncbi:GNAT family N-acetyltransferase [Amycolatopsis sp. H20-H5]|uniref:GNAT family N-acetyltransferase n=1 Tax=Amycolatopsis sp. H20-H5 TaxID=3046309 RepID=UPI002DB5AF79|nr:GNAT family N-acetyltransferase [Amycolatopsis sp. H20-H5]MEC3982048.1 GNAT family N-acetyltransferase [Amycolatopsis sp. H20-H5]
MTELRLAEVTRDNVGAACKLSVASHQESYVAPVAISLAEAYAQPDVAWPRLVFDGDVPVAFVMGAFEPGNPLEFFRAGVWRLNVGAGQQGNGYGRFAVEGVLAECRRRGIAKATVLWQPGEHSPEAFYLKLGFRKTGDVFHGQHVEALEL